MPRRRRQDRRRPPHRHQPDRRHPGHAGDHVGPGTGGIHQHRRLEHSGPGLDPPDTAGPGDPFGPGIRDDPAAMGPQPAREALQQAVDIDVAGVALQSRGPDQIAAEHRHQGDRLVRSQAFHPGALGEMALEGRKLVLGRHQHLAARRQQRSVDEVRGVELRSADGVERAQGGVAVVGDEDRRRPAGGVVADRRLALQHDHPGIGCQPGGGGDPGDAAADHQDVGGAGHAAPDCFSPGRAVQSSGRTLTVTSASSGNGRPSIIWMAWACTSPMRRK